jgi:hypothetical protein
MKAALDDFQPVALYAINQPMFVVDPSGPAPREVTFQGFGLACAAEGMPSAFLDQSVQLSRNFLVSFLPI